MTEHLDSEETDEKSELLEEDSTSLYSIFVKVFVGYRQFYTTYYLVLTFLASIVLKFGNDLQFSQ